jgi:hypothetical protein
MKKKLTVDKLYELISKSRQIYWNGNYYDVFYSTEEEFCLHDDDFEEYIYTYEEFIKELEKTNGKITFYQLVKIEY